MRYRLVRADIEGEIDMDLDPGPTTFCCIPRFVPTGIVPETIFESRKSEKKPTFRLSDFDIVTSLTEQVDCGNTVHIVSTLQMVTPDQTQCRSHILT